MIHLQLEADPTLGYAAQQNAVPVLRALVISNQGDTAITDLELDVVCSPGFAQGAQLRFDYLAPGETRRIAPIDLSANHTYLAELQESVKAEIRATARCGSLTLATATQPIEVLAYDQWAGTQSIPELLAAFCMPNNPAVDRLIRQASEALRAIDPSLRIDGYQSKSRDLVWKQVSAIYNAVCAQSLHYAEPPASFGTDGQKIRTPDRILEGRVATCLDLSMLFASCLEQAGLCPVVLLKQGHAWVGVWLHQTSFADPLTDDAQAIRKRVAAGEFLSFETTGVADHPVYRPSLRQALDLGAKHLTDDSAFECAIDIKRAREVQIKPLPSRGPAQLSNQPDAQPDPDLPLSIEPTPALPELDPALLLPLEASAPNTPAGRLSRWKSKLLDLTLRNKLLNFRPSKSNLQMVVPDLGRFEDALSEGAEFSIRPLPSLMEGTDPRMAEVHTQREGRAPLENLALEALARNELLTRVAAADLNGVLLTLHSAARTSLEEGGANTLYLALGLLKWTETEKAESSHLAPILLVPMTLQRQSVRSGFRLVRHDDEAIINPTLLQMLRQQFLMNTAALETLVADDKGIDVARVLQSFRLAIRDIQHWEVLEQAHLGIFSFTKYLMWKDLQDRTDQLKTNRVVKHLVDHPGEVFPGTGEPTEASNPALDEAYQPQDILAPLLADSSQLRALCAIDSGHDLVLEGPPGTGKSQTITNLIAHNLAQGKTVLFVSEKQAALDVVHRRLVNIGLGPFCLELHSSKTKKAEVLRQLGVALTAAGQRTGPEWDAEAQQLAGLRHELHALVHALHQVHRNGLTVYDAVGACIQNEGRPTAVMPWSEADAHDIAALEALRQTARRLSALAGALGQVQGHALSNIGRTQWSPTWQDELLQLIDSVLAAAAAHTASAQTAGQALALQITGRSLAFHEALEPLLALVLAAPQVPSGLARAAHDESARARVALLVRHGQQRTSAWQALGEGWSADLAQLSALELKQQWSEASSAWWPKSALAKRALKKRLAAYRLNGQAPEETQVAALFEPLGRVNQEDRQISALQADAQLLLAGVFEGVNTSWDDVARHLAWAEGFAQAVVRVAGPAEGAITALRTALAPLVGENRALLAADGAVGRVFQQHLEAWRTVQRQMQALEAHAEAVVPSGGAPQDEGAIERMVRMVQGWHREQRSLQPWCSWRDARAQAVAQGLQGVVAAFEQGTVQISEGPAHFEHSYRAWWLKKIVDQEPLLRSFSVADHERKIREFREADERFQKLTERYIVARLAARVPAATGVPVGAESELGRLRREMQKQRGHMPVRQLVRALPTLLAKLKPCLLMSPLSVAQYLDAGHTPFDLVVFDEASQIPVWDAVGAIARGQQLMVVGDPKQLPPTNFFSKSSDDETDAPAKDDVQDLESILDECLGAGMNQLSLQWHYRSRHESLITFSNVRYYDARLTTFPSPVTDDTAVSFKAVSGVYDRGGSRTNRREAQAVVDGIERHYLDPRSRHLSLGVVTFNQPQQALIETLLDERLRTNLALDQAISTASKEPLFVKNLENVQGDERDVIFFSITFGTDAAGKMTMNFGPLNGEGGHRRLNVAISRAREQVVIYSSLQPEQIDVAKVRAAGVRDLKNYLEFAIRGPRAFSQRSPMLAPLTQADFERTVIERLRERQWEVHAQVGHSGYRVDIGVVDPKTPGRYLLGVECDGATYRSGATVRDRDRLRQLVLEGLGWRIHRVWSMSWWMNPDKALNDLCALLESLRDQADAGGSEGGEVEKADAVRSMVSAQAAGSLEAGAPVIGTSSAHPVYAPTVLPPAPSSMDFYDTAANGVLAEHLARVADAEGPVSEAVLFRRVVRAWNLGRTGARIVERLQRLMPADVPVTDDAAGRFYWPRGAQVQTWQAYRVCSDEAASRRTVAEVCIEELAALACAVLSQVGASPRLEVGRAVCRMIGPSRMTPEAEVRINQSLERLVQMGTVVEREGVVMLARR